MRARLVALGVLWVLAGCGDDDGGAGDPDGGRGVDASVGIDGSSGDRDASTEGDAPGRAVTWSASDAPLANPERGFYRFVDLTSERDLDRVREGGDTLVFSYVRLDAYRNAAIAQALLDDLQEGLDVAREAGLKVILRFAYNEGPWPDSEPDAPLDRVLAHIEQLEPLLRANEDVIAIVQAGFIGAWGEWHTSTNGLDRDPDARRAVVEALLDAIPATRTTQLRYPAYKRALYGEPLEPGEAFAGSDEARVGHHNDCFLSSETDVGTYPEGEIETWLAYLESDTRFVPMGGETCAPFPARSSCAHAPSEMERLHFSYVNRDFHTAIVDAWEDEGCLDEIEATLGYRFVLVDGELPASVRPGGSFRARIRVRNEGWAAPFNPRAVWLVLASGEERWEVEIPESDVRRWAPGEVATIDVRVRVPASASAGAHTVALWLPDAAPTLRARADYAIRTANEGTWSEAEGWNALGTLEIASDAPGSADPEADALVILR